MNFRKPKDQVINEAFIAADAALGHAFYSIKNGYMTNNQTNNLDQIQYAISWAIREAVQSMVENAYTDEEFEKDLGIRS